MSTSTKRGPKKWPKIDLPVPLWKAQRLRTTASKAVTVDLSDGQAAWLVTADQLDAMAERMARAMVRIRNDEIDNGNSVKEVANRFARAALRSIGLVAKKGKL